MMQWPGPQAGQLSSEQAGFCSVGGGTVSRAVFVFQSASGQWVTKGLLRMREEFQ